jgi:hypothetical protein
MSDSEITKQIAQMKFFKQSYKLQKPKKPLHGNRRVSKKYQKIHEDYLATIEELNTQREASKLAYEIIINCVEYIIKIPDYISKIETQRKQIDEQRKIHLNLYKSFKEVTKLLEIGTKV